jgi:hypothetical protein
MIKLRITIMVNKNKKLIYGGIIAVIVLVVLGIFLFSRVSDSSSNGRSLLNKISPVSVLKYNDENSSIIITKNNIDKTAKMQMILFVNESEVKNDFMDLTEFTTTMSCGIMQMALFNQTALEEFNQEMQKLSEMNGTVEDESGKDVGTPENNPLEGYKITEFSFSMKDQQTKNELSSCKITGPSEEDRTIKIN